MDDPLARAVRAHQSGDLDAAESLYRRVDVGHPHYHRALGLRGVALLALGRVPEALDALEHAAPHLKAFPEVWNHLGVARKAVGRTDGADAAFRTALQADPGCTQARFNLGSLLEERGLLAEAEECFQTLVAVAPDDPEARARLLRILKARQKWPEAEALVRHAIARNLEDVDALLELAFLCAVQDRPEEAAAVYERVLAARPNLHEILNNLSYVYERLGRLSEAIEAAARAVELQPTFAEAYNNWGIALRSAGRLNEACACFQRAACLRPGFALAEFNLGTTHLLAGRYKLGWRGYRRSESLQGASARRFVQPRWEGGAIPGKRLLVHADQGFGDTLQFARFLKEVKARSQAEIVFECQAELAELFADWDFVRVVPQGTALPDFDFEMPLTHTAALLNIDLDSLSRDVPYLSAPQPQNLELIQALDAVENQESADAVENQGSAAKSALPRPGTKRRVGLVWQGNPRQARDHVRSCPLRELAPLFEISGVQWVSLQTGEAGLKQIREVPCARSLLEIGSRLRDFAETAAVLERLDLLITVDTAAAHLAGALGRPTWTLLGYAPDWRWHLDRADSPWYPCLRLFRQPAWGDWSSVVREAAAALRRWLSQ